MAYPVTKLITNAYYLSGLVGRELQTVKGQQLTDGLDMLNALLDIKATDGKLIPYFTQYTTNAVVNQGTYFIPGLIEAETVTFNMQSVRFSMSNQGRKKFFGTPRVDNISSLPMDCHIERTKNGATLYVYFLPNNTYPITIVGKFVLANVAKADDLQTTLDRYYIEYLRYALAAYICEFNKITFMAQATLQKYESSITWVSPLDLSVTKSSTLTKGGNLSWAYVNLGGGWIA